MTFPVCACNKRRFVDRAEAKRQMKRHRDAGHVTAYRCPSDDGSWHVGHRPDSVVQGRLDKDDWLGQNGGQR